MLMKLDLIIYIDWQFIKWKAIDLLRLILYICTVETHWIFYKGKGKNTQIREVASLEIVSLAFI